MRRLLYIAFLLLPVLNLKIISNINFNLSDVFFLILFFLIVFNKKTKYRVSNNFYFVLFGVYFLSAFASSFNSVNSFVALIGVLQHFFIFILVFFIIDNVVEDRRTFQNLIKILIFMAVFSVGFSIFSGSTNQQGRHFSFLISLSVYGLYLVSLIPFVFYFYITTRKKIIKLLYILGFLIISYGTLLSGSRSGVIIYALVLMSIIAYLIYNKYKNNIYKIFLMITLSFITIVSIINYDKYIFIASNLVKDVQPVLSLKLLTLLNENLASIDGARYENLSSFFDNFGQYWLLGVGFNNFHVISNGISLHNVFLAIWAELGILALISFVILLFYLIIRLSKRTISSDENLFKFSLLTSNISVIFFMMLHPMYSHRITWIFFVLVYVYLHKKFANEKIVKG